MVQGFESFDHWPLRSRRSIAPSQGASRHFNSNIIIPAIVFFPLYACPTRVPLNSHQFCHASRLINLLVFRRVVRSLISPILSAWALGTLLNHSSDLVIDLPAVAGTCVCCTSLAVVMAGDAVILTHATNSIGLTTRSKLLFTLICS